MKCTQVPREHHPIFWGLLGNEIGYGVLPFQIHFTDVYNSVSVENTSGFHRRSWLICVSDRTTQFYRLCARIAAQRTHPRMRYVNHVVRLCRMRAGLLVQHQPPVLRVPLNRVRLGLLVRLVALRNREFLLPVCLEHQKPNSSLGSVARILLEKASNRVSL